MQPQKALFEDYSTSPAGLSTKKTGTKPHKPIILLLYAIPSLLVVFLVLPPPLWGDKWPAIERALDSYIWFPWRSERISGNVFPYAVDFDWKKITPSSHLNWIDCYPGNQCARLEVPLDYSDPNGNKAAVALLRVKAQVSPDDREYRGPVLFNPGGPGGSGVFLVRKLGESFQKLLGKEYDIIGFDPRGIGETTPPVSAFSDQVEMAYWDAGSPPLLNSTPDSLPRAFSRAQMLNELVKSRSERAAQHASTAVVARDMLSITKAHGRDRLQYWGFSYGTVLGATYAAMFPDNVERLIIDGVVDFHDYYSGSWSKNLLDTDKILQFVYDKCAEADSCPLHANTSALVQQRVEAIFASIKANPVLAINGSDYGIIDLKLAKTALFQSLYQPFTALPQVLEALSALEGRDGRQMLTFWRTMEKFPKCAPPPPSVKGRKEAGTAVMCSDGEGVQNTLRDITTHFDKLSKISIFADIWTDITRISCAGWRVRAKERFAGPFSVNTGFPLLIIGNTADPVTPLIGAQKAAQSFEGSLLLTVNTPGHTSLAATSLCAMKIIRNYFREGELPNKGTICEVEDVLFGVKANVSQNITAEDAALLEVTRSLSQDFHASRGPSIV